MGINRYDKAPEWNPGVLPYELILKAADMTQQRWDKAKTAGDELANELFKSVKVTPRSVDEQVVLPGVMKEYQDLSTRLSNDPDMNPTKYQMEVGNFVNRNKSLLNRMTNLANLYQAGVTTKAGNMQDPKFRADNTYFDHTQTDFTKIDSRTQDPWEDQIGFKATQNYNPFITNNYLNEWVGTTMDLKKNPDGTFTSVSGKDIDNLAEKADVASSNYVTSENYQDHITSGRLDGMRPDDFLYPIDNKSYFGNKTMAELTPREQAKAMIMLTGVEQLNTKGMLSKGTASSSGSIKSTDPVIADPYPMILKAPTLTTNDIATLKGITPTAAGIVETVKAGTVSRPGMYTGDPQMDREAALVTTIESVLNNNNITGLLNNVKIAQDAVELGKSAISKREPGFEAEMSRLKPNEKLLESNILKLGETLKSIESQPQYLEVAAMLSEQGYDVKTPREMAQAYSELMLKQAQAKANMKPEQREILDAIAVTFGNTDIQTTINYSGENNVQDFGTHKAVKGNAVIGTEKEVLEKLNAESDGLIDLEGFKNMDFDGKYESVFGENSLDAAFPGMFVKVPVTKTVNGELVTTDMVGLSIYQPINLYSDKMKDNWNYYKLREQTNEEQRGKFMEDAPIQFINDRVDRTLKIFEDNPSHVDSWRMRLASNIATMPEKLSKIVKPMFNESKDDLQSFAYLYNVVTNFGNDREGLYKFLTQAEKQQNFQQPQSQQGNPLGGLQP